GRERAREVARRRRELAAEFLGRDLLARDVLVVGGVLLAREQVERGLLLALDLVEARGDLVEAHALVVAALFQRLVALLEQLEQAVVARDRVDLAVEADDRGAELGLLALELGEQLAQARRLL